MAPGPRPIEVYGELSARTPADEFRAIAAQLSSDPRPGTRRLIAEIGNARTVRRLRAGGYSLENNPGGEYSAATWLVADDPEAFDSRVRESLCECGTPFSACLCCCGLCLPCWLSDALYWRSEGF